MIVGVLTVRLGIFEAWTLKDKRRVTKSLKDRLRQRHNISIAEVGDLEHRQATTLGVAMVANEARVVQSALSKIVEEFRAYPHASLLEFDIELV